MSHKRTVLHLFILLVLTSCNNSESGLQRSDTATSNHLASPTTSNNIQQTLEGQIFLFAPELDSVNVKATGACDCCSSNILFISDTGFVELDYCESSTKYFKGSYHLDNERLVLTYMELVVNKDYNWKKETDTLNKNLVEYLYNTENIANETRILKRQNIKNKIVFKDAAAYGTTDEIRNFNEEIKQLKKEHIWTMLKL